MKRTIAAILIATALSSAADAQQKRMAVVDLSAIYMRQQPDYESALETQEMMGTVVEIVGEKGYWREIVSPQPYRAWATEKGLVEMTAEELASYEAAPKVMFTDGSAPCRALAAETTGRAFRSLPLTVPTAPERLALF